MSTCLALGSGHQLLEELWSSRRTGEFEGKRLTVGLGRHGEPKKPTALSLRVNYSRELGEESLRRREGPAEAIGHWNASDRPGHQSGQELRAAELKLGGREGTGDRKVGHTRLRRKTWVAPAGFHCHNPPMVASGNRWPVWRATMTI